jgi:lysophospholipid acyltransferase (LPLAT)-like uncharacterized protein
MKLKDIRRDFLRFLGNIFLSQLICVLCNTLKIKKLNSQGVDALIERKENFILAFWHGTMLIPWYVHREMNFTALVSKSKDGALLANLLDKWNYRVIRGSSNDGGRAALSAMIDMAKNNNTLCLTPDGPKGPIYKFKAGAVITSVKTGIPLVLCGVHYKKKRNLKSWDKFAIPKLYSGATIFYSEPKYFQAEISKDGISKIILECEAELNRLQAEAENK